MRAKSRLFVLLMSTALMVTFSGPAAAMKYMSLKDALTHFFPGAKSKTTKITKLKDAEAAVPAGKLGKLKKKYDLEDTGDFKNKLTAGPHTVYVGRDTAGTVKGYVMVLDQYWRTCYHKYAVGLDAGGAIKEMVVMEFNCKYQYPINKKSFLKQFNGKKGGEKTHVGKGIDVVSGATRSCEATAMVARKAMALYEVFFAK